MPSFRLFREVKRGKRIEFEDFVACQPALEYFKRYADRTGTLYCIQCQQFIKIGISADFDNRLKTLQSATPFPISVVALRTVPLAGLEYAESYLHQHFADQQVQGEWFKIKPRDLKLPLRRAQKRADIMDRHCREYAEKNDPGSYIEYAECQIVSRLERLDN